MPVAHGGGKRHENEGWFVAFCSVLFSVYTDLVNQVSGSKTVLIQIL